MLFNPICRANITELLAASASHMVAATFFLYVNFATTATSVTEAAL